MGPQSTCPSSLRAADQVVPRGQTPDLIGRQSFLPAPRRIYARFIAGWQHYGSGDAMGIPGFAGQKLLLATRYAVPDRGREGMTQGTEVGLRVLKSTALPWQNAVVFVGVE